MNTNSTLFLHLICYYNTKIRLYSGKSERGLIHAAQSYFPEEHGLLSIRWSKARGKEKGIIYTRDLTETGRHDLEQNSNEDPNVQFLPTAQQAALLSFNPLNRSLAFEATV